jgi:hypothetical protein
MTHRNQQARQARVRRSLDGVVASYIRDISVRTPAIDGRAGEPADQERRPAVLDEDRERAAA